MTREGFPVVPAIRCLLISLSACGLFLLTTLEAPAAELFPVYDVIRPNVEFWTRVYTRYTTSQAVIHDSVNLDIVYDVVDIRPYDAPGARKVNRNRLKEVKAGYERLLKRLAADPDTRNEACRRISKLFGSRAGSEAYRRAAGRVRAQIGQKDRFEAGLVRSGAYIDRIRSIFMSYGLPEDLACLPHVESSFDWRAYSKFGAAGMWQFTRSTGSRFMAVNYVLDERRDPITATHAAARLLKENFEKLGSWPLAITAYNHGAAGMGRAKAAHGDYPSIFTRYRSRTFKFASRNFYSEFLAARKVASDYPAYFGDLSLNRPARYRTISLDGYVSMEDVCAHFQTDTETVRGMNPALRPPVFNGQKYIPKGYRLHLPLDDRTGGMEMASIPEELYRSEQKPSRFYTVEKGDTAGRIARRHGVKLADLLLANNLDRRATIYPRQTLRIPLPGETATDKHEMAETPPFDGETLLAELEVVGAAESGRTAPLDAPVDSGAGSIASASKGNAEKTPENMPPAAVIAGPPASDAAVDSIMTVEGDDAVKGQGAEPAMESSLGSVDRSSAETGPPVPVEPVAAEVTMPETGPDYLPEEPALPGGTVPSAEIVAVDVGFVSVTQAGGQPVGILRVEVEETLGHYAEWAGVQTRQIRRVNALPFGQVLNLGQQLKIPLGRTTAQAFEEHRYEFHKRLQEDFFAAYRVGELAPYRVRNGDNLWTLCKEAFDVPMWLLQHYNTGADLAQLRPNQMLMIPGLEKAFGGDPGAVQDEGSG
ncbi:MAG: LysM peptidoglycan-binding domain-containing protein [Desulfobacterales bacterium]